MRSKADPGKFPLEIKCNKDTSAKTVLERDRTVMENSITRDLQHWELQFNSCLDSPGSSATRWSRVSSTNPISRNQC